MAKKRQLENGVSSFYDFMAKAFPPKKTYVGIQYMQNAIGRQEGQEEMRYILGVTLRHYFLEFYPLILSEDVRLKKKMRLSLFRKARMVISTLFQQ